MLSEGVDKNHIIRFAFDSADDLLLIDEDILDISEQNRKVDPRKFMKYLAGKIVDDEMYYLLLDEVQLLGNFEAVLNGYMRKDNLDIYVTGSNSKFLSSDILTEFEGRGDENMFCLCLFRSFILYMKAQKKKHLTILWYMADYRQ